jgi:hypothetical protein
MLHLISREIIARRKRRFCEWWKFYEIWGPQERGYKGYFWNLMPCSFLDRYVVMVQLLPPSCTLQMDVQRPTKITIQVLWCVLLCWFVNTWRGPEESLCLHFQGLGSPRKVTASRLSWLRLHNCFFNLTEGIYKLQVNIYTNSRLFNI